MGISNKKTRPSALMALYWWGREICTIIVCNFQWELYVGGRGSMLSNPYPSKGTAKGDAKIHAEQNGLKEFILMVDLENRQYHFSDEEVKPGCKMVVFGRYKFSKGKWLEKPLLRKESKKGA